uniref:F-box domain-containing protein n=1 Tax=Caenorhabditis tropicalis TaxID=1561998 RepID=A0A1I7UT70_9PELO
MSFVILPDLVIEEIVKSLSQKEILFIASLSLRARRRLSRHTKSRGVEIRIVDDRFDSCVEIISDDQLFYRIKIDTHRGPSNSSWRFKTLIPVWFEKDNLISHWRTDDNAFQDILDFLMEIFRIEEVSFEINLENSCSAVKCLEHCALKNLKIGLINWKSFIESDEMAKRVMIALKGAPNLKIKGFNSKSFFDNFHLFRVDQLKIEDAMWMTVENVMALRNCKKVHLEDVSFKTSDISRIFREFKKDPGEMQELHMDCRNEIRLEEMVKGLYIDEEDKFVRHKIYFNSNGTWFSLSKLRLAVKIAKEF